MKRKPITTFLKVMSILTLIQSVLGILINGLAVFLSPLMEDVTGEPVDMMSMISIWASIVCLVINFILAIMALQHKNIGLVYRVSIFTLIFVVVFNAVGASGASGYLSVVASAVIPALFYYAAYRQNQIDQAQ